MDNTEPLTIVVGPFELWLGPDGEAFPDVDTPPGGNWVLLGTSGTKNYSEAGVTITTSQDLNEHFVAGSTLAQKVTRSKEGFEVSVELEDFSAEAFSKAFNGNLVNEVAAGSGTPGYKSVSLYRGSAVTTYTLLCRGASPYSDTGYGDFRVYKCYQSDSPAMTGNKTDAIKMKLTFKALENPNSTNNNDRFAELVEYTSPAA